MGIGRLDQIRDNLRVFCRDVESLPGIDGQIKEQWRVVRGARLGVVVRAAGDEVRLVVAFPDCSQLVVPVVEQLIASTRSGTLECGAQIDGVKRSVCGDSYAGKRCDGV